MTESFQVTSQAQSSNPFHARCQDMGCWAWDLDPSGKIIESPRGNGYLHLWLNSDALRSRIEREVHAWLNQPQRDVVECFRDYWLIPLPSANHQYREGMTVILALGKRALDEEWFQIICASAALDVQEVRNLLAPWARYEPADVKTLEKVLNWMSDDLRQAELNQQIIDQFSEKMILAYEQTILLFKLARYMNRVTEPAEMMQAACTQMYEILPFEWAAVQFNRSNSVTPDLAGRFFLSGNLPCDPTEFQQRVDKLLYESPNDGWTRLLDPQQSPLAAMVQSEIVIDPITHDDHPVGGILAGNKRGPDSDIDSSETQFVDAMSDLLSVFHQNISRFAQQRELFWGTLRALTASIDAKDAYTRGHSQRVALLASQLASAMGMNADQVERVRISGIVHDVGKIGVPEAVLCKRGRLTDEEFELIKKHPTIGYYILKDIPPMHDVLPGVLYHHERWDGRGYPSGLSELNIPLFGRILALADTFDAMSSDRSYRAAISRDKVIGEIKRCSGSQFDPELANIFISLNFESYDEMIQNHKKEIDISKDGISSD